MSRFEAVSFMVRWIEWRWSNPSSGEQHDENNDNKAGTAADVMITGAEAVTTTSKKQKNEQDYDDVHGDEMGGYFAMTGWKFVGIRAMGCTPRFSLGL